MILAPASRSGGVTARGALAALGLTLLALLAPRPTSAQEAAADDEPGAVFAVRVGRLYTGRPGEVLSPAVIVVRGGRIESVLAGDDALVPAGVPVLDRRHLTAAPGLVLAQRWVGTGRRGEETVGARYQAIDAFDPYAHEQALLARGVTTAFLSPGRGRLVTGSGAVVKLGGPPSERVLRAVADLVVDLGETGLRPPARVRVPVPSSSDVPIEPAERQRPTSRLGAAVELTERLRAALEYEAARSSQPAATRPAFDPDLEALADALAEGRLRIDVRRAPDVEAAIELALDLGLRPVLAGLTEAGPLAIDLAALDAPCVVELPWTLRGAAGDRGDDPDRLDARADTAARLARAGIDVALAPAPGSEPDLRLLAGLAVRGGLDPGRALAGVTRVAAEVLGIADRVGALDVGLDADLILLTGDPLSTRAEVVETWVSGRPAWRAPGVDAVVLRAGTVHTLAGEPLRPGEVLVERGAIAAVGSSVPRPRGARVIDVGPDGVLTPGFVDAYGHLGLQGERMPAPADLPLHGLVGRDTPGGLDLARSGVTTVALAPWGLHGAGSRVAAVKTAAGAARDASDLRRGMVVREVAGLAFDLSDMDPLVVPGAFEGRLQAGKAYAAAWEKYRAELSRWQTEQARRALAGVTGGSGGAAPDKPGEKPADKPAPDKPGPTPDATPKADPISGRWATTISGGPLPRPQTGEMLLRLEPDGATVRGVVRSPAQPGEAPVSGTLTGTKLALTLEIESPMGQPRVEAELDQEDHLRGKVKLGPFELDFDASRTTRELPELKIEARRTGRGGRPAEPAVDAALEPLRLAFEGRAVLVLHARSAVAATTLLDHVGKHGLRAVFVGLDDADLVAPRLRAADAGVLLLPGIVAPRPGAPEHQPALALARAGVPLGFMSNAEDGARELPLRAVVAVHAGLSEGDALAALTIGPARLLSIADRVGSLEAGKDGDVVAWDGPPFEASSRIRAVVVRGRVVDPE